MVGDLTAKPTAESASPMENCLLSGRTRYPVAWSSGVGIASRPYIRNAACHAGKRSTRHCPRDSKFFLFGRTALYRYSVTIRSTRLSHPRHTLWLARTDSHAGFIVPPGAGSWYSCSPAGADCCTVCHVAGRRPGRHAGNRRAISSRNAAGDRTSTPIASGQESAKRQLSRYP